MSNLPLKSETRFPLIVDGRNGQPPFRLPRALRPRFAPAQQAISNVDRDLDAKASGSFVDDAICPPSWAVRRCGSNPVDQLLRVKLREAFPARTLERCVEAGYRLALSSNGPRMALSVTIRKHSPVLRTASKAGRNRDRCSRRSARHLISPSSLPRCSPRESPGCTRMTVPRPRSRSRRGAW